MRTFLMLFALTLAWNVSAQSPDQPLPKTKGTTQQAKTDKRGTEQSPIVIKVIPPLIDDKKSAAEKKEREEKSQSDWWLVKLTGVLALIGLLQLFVFGLQARRLRQTIAEMKIATKATEKAANAAERTVETMDDTAERQLRAYVFIDTITILNIANPIVIEGNPLIVPTGAEVAYPHVGPLASMVIKNSGQTPAYSVVILAGICVREYPLSGVLPPRQTTLLPTKSALPPGGKSTSNVRLPNPLSNEQITGLRGQTLAIYVHGDITYIDAFGKTRVTNFSFIHNSVTGAVGVCVEMTICDEGNEAT